jgi:hypothetical protein
MRDPNSPAEPRSKIVLKLIVTCSIASAATLLVIGIIVVVLAQYAADHQPASLAGARTFINSREGLPRNLAENYLDFSFNYPASWELSPATGKDKASSFVKVERKLPDDFTIETFSVGYYSRDATTPAGAHGFAKMAGLIEAQLSKQMPEYQKLSEGRTTINRHDGYEFRFRAMARQTPHGDVTIWGRVALLAESNPALGRGPVLFMIASSLAPGVQGIDDVGVKGELPVIVNSFKLGPAQRSF